MSILRANLASALVVGLFFSVSCMEQYDPRPQWKQFEEERLTSERQLPTLTEDGKLPSSGVTATPSKYATLCAACHGAAGEGSDAMDPKPRDFTDKEWQASVTDKRIASVIKEGGGPVGLSNTMPGWGAMVTDAEIKTLVKEIRAFSK